MKPTTHTFPHKYGYGFCLFLLFSLALFLRTWQITQVPDITHMDEAGLGYNAWCLAHYGVDRYLNAYPIYPQNYGFGGQSPLYTYLVVLLVRTVGGGSLSLFLVRLPGVLSSMLTVLAGTWLLWLVFGNKRLTLLGAFLLSICPYFVMHGRVGLDCNLMLGCSTLALALLFQYLHTGKLRDLLLYSMAFGLVLYTYALSYLMVPVFLALVTLYMLAARKITFRRALLSAACVCVTALPILLFVGVLLFGLPPFSFLGMTIAPVGASRVSEVAGNSLGSFLYSLLEGLRMSLTYGTYPQDAVPGYWTLYPLSVPLIAIGFCQALRQLWHDPRSRSRRGIRMPRQHKAAVPPHRNTATPRCCQPQLAPHGPGLSASLASLVFLCYLAACLLAIGLAGSPQVYRVNYIFPAYLFFLVQGIRTACHGISALCRLSPGRQRWPVMVFSICYLLYGISFGKYYFTEYSIAGISPYPNSLYMVPANEAITDAMGREDIQDIYMDYIGVSEYFSFYFPRSPLEVQETTHGEPLGEYQLKEGYGRYHFVIDNSTPLVPGNAYIVHNGNQAFVARIEASGQIRECVVYENYFLYIL